MPQGCEGRGRDRESRLTMLGVLLAFGVGLLSPRASWPQATPVAQGEAAATPPSGASTAMEDAWNLFKDDEEGFQVELPNDWVVIRPDLEKAGEAYRKQLQAAAVPDWLIESLVERAAEGHRVTAVHAVRTGAVTRSVASVAISVKHLPSPLSSLYLAQMAAAAAGETIKAKEPIPVKAVGLPAGTAHTFSYSYTVKGSGASEVRVNNSVILLCQGSRAFVLECACLAEEASHYGPLFGRLARSLALAPSAATESGGETWSTYPVPSAGITMELPAPAVFMAVFGQAVPPKATPFIGRVMGLDCVSGPLRFYVLMGFHRADSGPRVMGDFLEGPGRAALVGLFPSALDNSGAAGGQSSAETQRAVRQNGYEAIRWELVGMPQGGRVALHCMVFATGETAYLVAFYHPEGDAKMAGACERALASCRAEDESEEGLGQVSPFLREPAEDSLLKGPWASHAVGMSGFSLSLPEPMALGEPSRPPGGADPSQPRYAVYTCNARGIGLIIQTVSAKGALWSASTLLMMGLQGATSMMEQMGFDSSKIKKTPLDANTIKIEGSALGLTPGLHMTIVVTAREGRSCFVAIVTREGDLVAGKIAEKVLKSLK